MKSFIIKIVVISSIFFIFGCSSVVKMGMIGTKNIDITGDYSKSTETLSHADLIMLLAIPLKMDDANMMEVIDKALEKEGYDFMTDTKVKSTYLFTYIVNYVSIEVRGTGWKKKGKTIAKNSSANPNYFYAAIQDKNKIFVEKTYLASLDK